MMHGTLKFTGRWILVDVRVTKGSSSKLGITVTKRYGSACQRNRFKRLVREAFRLSYPHYLLNFDILVRPRSQALEAKLKDIQLELVDFVNQASSHSSSRPKAENE